MPGNMWFMYYPHPKEDFINRINDQKSITLDIVSKVNGNIITKIDTINDKISEEKMYLDFNPYDFSKGFWTNQIALTVEFV